MRHNNATRYLMGLFSSRYVVFKLSIEINFTLIGSKFLLSVLFQTNNKQTENISQLFSIENHRNNARVIILCYHTAEHYLRTI